MYGLEKHHIIFRSQGGLDFPLNYIYLNAEDHRGNKSPHRNKSINLKYKETLERELREILTQEHYHIKDLINILELNKKQAYKAFRHMRTDQLEKDLVIYRLLGSRYYL